MPELVAKCRDIKLDGPARTGITALPDIFVARYLGHSSEQAKCYFIDTVVSAATILCRARSGDAAHLDDLIEHHARRTQWSSHHAKKTSC